VVVEQWHRCKALVLEGVRAGPEQAPLPGKTVSRGEVAAAMRDIG